MRRRSSSCKNDSGDEEPEIRHSDFFLDDKLPEEYFKQDIINLAHELHVPGWSSVALDMAEDLLVVRITGALTNSVYSVRAPSYVKETLKKEYEGRTLAHRIPQHILLRVYGPQVDSLIDRQRELSTVALLTRNKIGPRLFGTFKNGRFEQFLNAKPLHHEDLWKPETSRLIAKRMREFHDSIPLSAEQRAGGPVAWAMLRKWEIPVRERFEQLEVKDPGITERVLQCGLEQFLATIAEVRKHIEAQYKPGEINKSLVLAHNDTQYGNILRVEPPKGSPLIMPQNEHRQLVVIDFEYSGPNVPAYDIVNHFCEWMGDYHHPTMPHHIWLERYPTKEQQMIFINSYVEHGSPDFDEATMEAEANELYKLCKLWRPIVSSHWAFWGIVQTPIPGQEDLELRDGMLTCRGSYDVVSSSPPNPVEIVDEVDEFDCMAYAKEKISLFWEDVRALGVKI
ncbi:Choline kinase [Wickerhamiella sorbophila]|uniref:Choline kinase n=1 Tax=Wickerhamiella sorbophila TaxID=45607 RepID=A0A2T0FMK6_9ASCO|nr:Choline kinase [Wickerhamiella sorbophila]PRT56205.1 Choline kinase [Wickerhamiella sorbophila]